MSTCRKLLVVSHVIHYEYEGKLHAYGPYSREIDIWADLFSEVVIASPCRHTKPPGDCLPFDRPNISITPQIEAGGDHWFAKLKQILLLPIIFWRLSLAMWKADAIHVRCPGNLGLFGCILAPLFSRYRIAKFAGQWNGYRRETKTVRLQRMLLKSRWWGAPVTVYGYWPNQPSHIIPFFTSMMTTEQVRHAVLSAKNKILHQPLRILFSGRLVPEKRISTLIEALALAKQSGLDFEATIVGDGIERAALEEKVKLNELENDVRFIGALPFDESLRWNEWADCLVLPSQNSEGWPKVIAEAMCYGVVCIGVDHGQVGRMLEGRGFLLPHGDAQEIVDAILEISNDADAFSETSKKAGVWARQYSIDGLRSALAKLLEEKWKVSITIPNASIDDNMSDETSEICVAFSSKND
jgi:glycosyltransferase involved in cell wall biosynthesis